jgi:SEC-C motif
MKVGRNDPCHCGSGKKYKHCCMLAAAVSASAPPELLWRRLRTSLEGLPQRMMAFVEQTYGAVLMAA